MNKKIISLFLLMCFSLSCFGFTVVASSIPDKIDGPASLLKPMDGSFTKIKYSLLDDEGEPIDDRLVTWSASGGLVISENGYILLSKDTIEGNYIINAEVGGISAPAKTISVKSGAYLTNTYTSGTINMISTGFRDDCNFEFDFSAPSASNSAALFLKLLENDSNWHFPVYLRSHATNYKLRFDDYSGENGANKRQEYTTPYAYNTTQTMRVKFNYDEATDYISSFSVYLNDTLIDLFDNCVVMSKGTKAYQGIRELTVRNTISMSNIKLYSGEKVDSDDPDYKYTGVTLSGEDTLSAPRKNNFLTSQYNLKNVFGTTLNNEATWNIAPEGKGVSVDSDGLVYVAKDAIGGNYTLTATANGVEYSKFIEISSVEYNLVLSGRTEYVRDFTTVPNQLVNYNGGSPNTVITEVYTAADQFGEPVNVSWTLEGAPAFSYTLTSATSNFGTLILPSTFPDGTYTLKATADSDEGFSDPVATLTITVKPATYEITGPDTIVTSDGTCNVTRYALKSSLGNTYENRLEWRADNVCILPSGDIIISKELPETVNLSVATKLGTYTKNISVSSTGTVTGTPLNGSLEYTGSDKFPLQSGVNEKILSADLVGASGLGVVDDSDLDIDWTITDISGYSDGSVPDARIEGKKLIVNGKYSGVITVQGKLKHTPIKTAETDITLTGAFAAINGSVLTIKGSSDDSFTIEHYKPLRASFIDGVLETDSMPATSTAVIETGSSEIKVNLDLSKSGKHKIVVYDSQLNVNEYTIIIDGDKLFYQNDVKNLLENNRINDYLNIYTNADASLIEDCSVKYAALTSEQKDTVLRLTNKDFDSYFVSVMLIDFLAGDLAETETLKSMMSDNGLSSLWVDILKADIDRTIISNNVINTVASPDMMSDTVILQAVKNASVSNTKEAKPYLAICNSAKYNSANDTQKNLIADAVSGKTYANMQQLLNAINAVNILPGNQGGGGVSSGGGKTQTGTIGGYSPSVTPAPNPVIPGNNNKTYNDVTNEHWAYEYVKVLSNKGIINGFEGDVFMPDTNVTRAEFLKMLAEAFSVTKTQDEPFADVNSYDWFSPYVSGAYSAGLVKGDGQNFRPNEKITRQDAAVMIYRFATHYGCDFSANGNSFSDKDVISDYAIESINALVSAKIINGMPDGTFAPTNNATRAEAAKMIYGILEKGGVR